MNSPSQPETSSLWELRRLRRDPFAFLHRLAAEGDVASFRLRNQRCFLVNHPDLIEVVLVSSAARFIKAPALQRATRLLGRGLLTSEAPVHAQRRRVIQPVFHRQRMDGYADAMARRAAAMSDSWRHEQVLDVSEQMSNLTLAIVGETLFSADLTDYGAELRKIVAEAVTSLDPLVSLVAPRRRLRPARARLEAIVDTLIADHETRVDRPPDLLDLLIEAAPDSTPAQLHDDAITMLLAGFDTITNALTWTWAFLSQHPAAEAELAAELDRELEGRHPGLADMPRLVYTRAVLAESLRVRPPAWILARQAIEDTVVGGVRMPAGALVLISSYLVHRDPRFFPSPLAFDPSRWLGEAERDRPKLAYLPFGAGKRSCVGESFAWMEGVLVLATLAQRWRLRLAGSALADVDPRITLRPRGPVLMIPQARGVEPAGSQPSNG
jgi:cytochrome P450